MVLEDDELAMFLVRSDETLEDDELGMFGRDHA